MLRTATLNSPCLVHAVFSVSLRADQIVSGFAINFLALGLTGYIFLYHYGEKGTPDNLPQVPDVSLPITSIPFFGPALDNLNLLVWIALLLVLLVWLFVFRTPTGLRLRSVGENPRAAATVGISVYKVRYLSVIASGALAAMGGAFLSLGFVHSFSQNMTAGRGFIALAVVIVGKWRPGAALAGGADVRLHAGARAAPADVLGRARRRCCRRCPTWSR